MTTRQTANKIITLLIEGGTLRRNVWAADITQELALEAVEFPTTFKIDIAGQRVYRTTIDHDFLQAFLDVRLAGRLRMVERLGNNFVTSKIDTVSLDESVIRNVYMLVQSGQVTHVSNLDPVTDPSLFDVNSEFDPGVLVISQEVEIISANVSQVPHIQNPQVPDHINTDFVGTDDSGLRWYVTQDGHYTRYSFLGVPAPAAPDVRRSEPTEGLASPRASGFLPDASQRVYNYRLDRGREQFIGGPSNVPYENGTYMQWQPRGIIPSPGLPSNINRRTAFSPRDLFGNASPLYHAGDVLAAYYNPDNLADRRLEVIRRVETHPYGIPIYVMEVYHGAVGDTPRFFTGFHLSFGTVQEPAAIGSELWHTPIMVQKVGVISDPYNVLFPIDGAAIISNDNQRLYNHRLFHIHYSQWDDGYFFQSAGDHELIIAARDVDGTALPHLLPGDSVKIITYGMGTQQEVTGIVISIMTDNPWSDYMVDQHFRPLPPNPTTAELDRYYYGWDRGNRVQESGFVEPIYFWYNLDIVVPNPLGETILIEKV